MVCSQERYRITEEEQRLHVAEEREKCNVNNTDPTPYGEHCVVNP